MQQVWAVLLGAALTCSAADWIRPFDGKTLRGWKTTGKAEWRVEKNELIGFQGPGGAPGDIFTEQQWKDFELEAEWQLSFPGNSGIWFRWAGPNTGCQADFIDNEPAFPGVLSGSVYCMGKQFVGVNKDPSTIRKDGWNKIRMRVVGESVVVWLNGREVVRAQNTAQSAPGSIGVQVHAGKQFAGMEVRVRHMRIRDLTGGSN